MNNPPRSAVFHPEFVEDLRCHVESHPKTAQRAVQMIQAILRDPCQGIGKPEPLKQFSQGVWSRRLTRVDRIVYRVQDDRIDFLQARYHHQ